MAHVKAGDGKTEVFVFVIVTNRSTESPGTGVRIASHGQ